jgi:osmotically-inducible protein OsmY
MTTPNDELIQNEIVEQLKKNGLENIHINASNGIVTLKEEVTSEAIKLRAKELAANVSGVEKVENDLNIKEDSGVAHAVSVIASEISKLTTEDDT